MPRVADAEGTNMKPQGHKWKRVIDADTSAGFTESNVLERCTFCGLCRLASIHEDDWVYRWWTGKRLRFSFDEPSCSELKMRKALV